MIATLKAHYKKGIGLGRVSYLLFCLLSTISACTTAPPSTATPAPAPTQTLPPAIIQSRPTVTAVPAPPTPAATDIATAALPTPTPSAVSRQTALDGTLDVVRVGHGDIKVLIAAQNTGLGRDLTTYFTDHPDAVPPSITLILLPELHAPYLLTDAETNYDTCPDNDGVSENNDHPFSLPEGRLLRDLSAESQLTLFYSAGDRALIQTDSCGVSLPAIALSQRYQAQSSLPSRPVRPTAGHFLDYWANEGIAAIHLLIDDDALETHLPAVIDVLTAARDILSADAAAVAAQAQWLDADNSSRLTYSPGLLSHPIGLIASDTNIVVVDSGRLVALSLDGTAPRPFLSPGDLVDFRPVQEIIDVTLSGDALFALDRAGDVYRWQFGIWSLDRYDRPVRDLSAHYYVSLAATGETTYLLESSYRFAFSYQGEHEQLWNLPDARPVSLATQSDSVYILSAAIQNDGGALIKYRATATDSAFHPNIPIIAPRQVVATVDAIYVLDHGGRRILALHPATGRLQTIMRFSDGTTVSAIAANGSGQLIAAGRNTLYLLNQPDQSRQILENGLPPIEYRVLDFSYLNRLSDFAVPLGNRLAERDFQMPGAPRHYRLGIHQGADFYWQTGAQIAAAADGVVIRAMHDYVIPQPADFDYWRAQSLEYGETSAEAQDFYRGRQLWIQHADGIVTRYVHLASIDPAMVEGAAVQQGQIIARVGNSGSPSSINSETEDAHLHFELWIDDNYLGFGLRPIETRTWLRRILH